MNDVYKDIQQSNIGNSKRLGKIQIANDIGFIKLCYSYSIA